MLAEIAAKEKMRTNTYTYNEVYAECIRYFKNDELAATTWMNKYAMRDREGNFLESTPDAMHRRMAREFARIEARYEDQKTGLELQGLSAYGLRREMLTEERIYQFFQRFQSVIPQGSVMAGLGNPHMLSSLSNCVVMPKIYDSYGGIFKTDQQLAQLFKRRCGVGVDLSTLRPANTPVSNAAGTTSGAVSFMERFSNTTREVAQNGRRGALMLTMDIAHPDVEDFISVKQDLTKVTGANISVRISDEFMRAVQNDTEYTHRWPIDSDTPEYTKTIKAMDLWKKDHCLCAQHRRTGHYFLGSSALLFDFFGLSRVSKRVDESLLGNCHAGRGQLPTHCRKSLPFCRRAFYRQGAIQL